MMMIGAFVDGSCSEEEEEVVDENPDNNSRTATTSSTISSRSSSITTTAAADTPTNNTNKTEDDEDEDEDDDDNPRVGAWRGLLEAIHTEVVGLRSELTRTHGFLFAENNLLRTRQAERERLLGELRAQDERRLHARMEVLELQVSQVLDQQGAVLDALKVFTIAFEIGRGPPPRPPPPPPYPPPPRACPPPVSPSLSSSSAAPGLFVQGGSTVWHI